MNATKVCKWCGKCKSLGDFYKHPGMKDGHLNKCKACVIEYARADRQARLEVHRARDRERYRTPHRRAQLVACVKKHRRCNPDKARARSAVSRAIREGKLERKPCEVCGYTKVEGHHDDYARPLEVRWLCRPHHRQVHREA